MWRLFPSKIIVKSAIFHRFFSPKIFLKAAPVVVRVQADLEGFVVVTDLDRLGPI
jgi:hypothetical protein